MAGEEATQELGGKVHEWLTKEGYPLEYYAASVFSAHRFRVEQGAYVRSGDEAPREVDVLASKNIIHPADKWLVRVYTVAECKWTRAKPWVVFTSPTAAMAPSAVIAQSIASELGQAAIWVNAGHRTLLKTKLFESSAAPGFGGRQALAGGSDLFFNSLRSVAGAANALATRYDIYRGAENFPDAAVIAFPLIIIDGDLFSASYDAGTDNMSLAPTDHLRLHWRGDPSSLTRTTVDIVTRSGLPTFAAKRAEETEKLLKIMDASITELRACYFDRKVEPLTVRSAPTGMLGQPSFLRLLRLRAERREEKAAGEG